MTLFGVAVPADAVRLIVRPILGRGGALPLYVGPIDDETSETDVVVYASKFEPFWQYIAQRGVQPSTEGMYAWKLRLTFTNSSGVEESHTTTETVDFFCALGAGAGDKDAVEDAASRIVAMAAQAIKDVGVAATNIMQAAAAPLTRAIEMAERREASDAATRQDLMESVAVLSMELRNQPQASSKEEEPDLVETLMKAGGLFVAVTKGLEYLKKNKGDPN